MSDSWKPDKNMPLPMHKQIFEYIRSMIIRGEYKSGHRFSIRKSATDYGVGVNTVREAFENLKTEGLITAQPRSSMVVSNDAWCRAQSGSYDWQRVAGMGKQMHNSDMFIEACRIISTYGGLGMNTDAFDPAWPVVKAMQDTGVSSALSKHICDYNRYGYRPLREEAAKYMKRYGIDVSPDEVVIFGGAYEAYNAVCSALLRPGMNVHTLRYDRNNMVKTVQSTGASLAEMSDNDFSRLARKISRRGTDMLHITCVNHFPTGATLAADKRDELLSLVKKLQLPVVELDLFRDIWNTPPPPPLKAGDTNNLIIYIGTFSQLAHSGSFKLAWGVIPEVIRERICDVSLQIYQTNSIVNEIISYVMLKEGYYADYISRLNVQIKERVDAVDGWFRKYFGDAARWNKNDLSHFIWLDLPGVDMKALGSGPARYYFAAGAIYGAPSFINMNTLCWTADVLEENIKTVAREAGGFAAAS